MGHRQKHPSEEQGCPRPLCTGVQRRPFSTFAGDDGAGGRQPGSWLRKCLTCTSVAQIQTERLVSAMCATLFPSMGTFPPTHH